MERRPLDILYLNPKTNTPWGFKEPSADETAGMSADQIDEVYLHADQEALNRTQRKIGAGVVAVMGVGVASLINPPEDYGDVARNLFVPATVQLISYRTMKRAIGVYRRLTLERRRTRTVNED